MALACVCCRLNPSLRQLLVGNVAVERRALVKLSDLVRLTLRCSGLRNGLLLLVATAVR